MLTEEKIESYIQRVIRGLRKSIFKELDSILSNPENNLDPVYKERLNSLNSQWNAFLTKKMMGTLIYSEERQTENIIRTNFIALLQEIKDDVSYNSNLDGMSQDYSIPKVSHLVKVTRSIKVTRLVEFLGRPLTKLALVMGCGDYMHIRKINNAINDAEAIGQALQEAGFEVSIGVNLTHDQMIAAIDQFGAKADQFDVGLIYFAGCGMEIDGVNYLIPVDASIKKEEPVGEQCIALSSLLGYMTEGRAQANIIILDAARTNPFKDGSSKGLSRYRSMKENAPIGSLVAYSTAPTRGTREREDLGHGLYTSCLLRWMGEKELMITDLLMRVRRDVARVSKNSQISWESISLKYNFSLHD